MQSCSIYSCIFADVYIYFLFGPQKASSSRESSKYRTQQDRDSCVANSACCRLQQKVSSPPSFTHPPTLLVARPHSFLASPPLLPLFPSPSLPTSFIPTKRLSARSTPPPVTSLGHAIGPGLTIGAQQGLGRRSSNPGSPAAPQLRVCASGAGTARAHARLRVQAGPSHCLPRRCRMRSQRLQQRRGRPRGKSGVSGPLRLRAAGKRPSAGAGWDVGRRWGRGHGVRPGLGDVSPPTASQSTDGIPVWSGSSNRRVGRVDSHALQLL